MSRTEDALIAIVGGGIAGLALVRALRQHGLHANVFERRRSPSDGGLAINLPGNAVQALAALGLGDAVAQQGHAIRRREYRTERDTLLFEIDEEEFWGTEACPRSIRRSVLMKLLRHDVGHLLHDDVDVRSVMLHPDRVDLQCSDGKAFCSHLVVGADGVRSIVRDGMLGVEKGTSYSILARASWRFMVPNPGIDCWTVWVGPRGMILLLPVSDAEVYGWAAVTHQSAQDSPAALELLSRAFPDRVRKAVAAALSLPAAIHHSPLEEVRLRTWTRGRAVLMGDAAHACAPVWAQGGALALEDGIVLAECLAAGQPLPVALGAYELRRRPRVQHVQAMTDAMSKAAKLPTIVRNLLMPFMGPKRYRQTYSPLRALP